MGVLIKYNGLGGKLKFSGASTGGFKARYVASTSALLLDTYPGAAAAYSVRKLRTAYTGSAIRVRRSSDNTEQDIGFVNNVLDTTALTTFVGANNGFVTTWYDQSGNSKNATQATAGAQPKIVNTGVVYTKNSRPTVFNGTNIYLSLSSNFTGTAGTLINVSATVLDPPGSNGVPIGGIGDITQASHQTWSDGNIYETFATSVRKTVGNPSNNITIPYLYSVVSDTNFFDVKINNAAFYSTTTNTVAYNTNGGNLYPKIGVGVSGGGFYYFEGYISEIIVYTSNQNSSLSGINSNINSYYSIY
jgi:hypothetical protein